MIRTERLECEVLIIIINIFVKRHRQSYRGATTIKALYKSISFTFTV